MSTPDAAPTPASLWRHRSFLTLWGGQTLSTFGDFITELAIPVLAVLVLHASDAQVGFLNAVNTAAFLLIGLPAGAWIDRMRKRHVMLTADLVRAVALAAIPVLHFAGTLQMWHLYLVMLVVGFATVFFDVAYQSIIPSLVDTTQIGDANGKLESTNQIMRLAGPAVGGWLVKVLSAPVAVIVDVASYLVSVLSLSFTRDHETLRAPEEREPLMKEVAEGLRWVFGNPLLRRIVMTTTLSNLGSVITFTLLPIFLLRILGLDAGVMGLVFSAGAVGGLIGSLTTTRLARRIGEGRTIPLSTILFALPGLALPLAVLVPRPAAIALLIAVQLVMSFAVVAYNITQVTFRQRITPPRLLGRMNASIRFCVYGIMPIGALIAGGLGTALGTVGGVWVGVIVTALAMLPMVFGPFWRIRELPDPVA